MPAKKTAESAAVPKNKPTFEQALERLTRIAEILENETPALDQALALYEESAALLKDSAKQLQDAETKITVLSKNE